MANSYAPARLHPWVARNYTSSASSTIVHVNNLEPRQLDPFDGFDVEYSEPGWDGDDARPISAATLLSARRFHAFLSTVERDLPVPNIAPGPDGTIGFEWRLRNGVIKKLFVEIRDGDLMRAYWLRSGVGSIERQPLRSLNVAMYSLQSILSELSDAG